MTRLLILILHNYVPFLIYKHCYQPKHFPNLVAYSGVSMWCAVYVSIQYYSAWVIDDITVDVSHCHSIVLVLLH
jgi:hypothetical protein